MNWGPTYPNWDTKLGYSRGSEGEDYHEMFLIKRRTFKEPVMWKKKLCSTSSLYWFFHVWSRQPRQIGGAAGERVFPCSSAFEKDIAQGWRSSFSMPWSLFPASRSSTFLSKCGVASVTVPNVAAEGERINLRQLESSTTEGLSSGGELSSNRWYDHSWHLVALPPWLSRGEWGWGNSLNQAPSPSGGLSSNR